MLRLSDSVKCFIVELENQVIALVGIHAEYAIECCDHLSSKFARRRQDGHLDEVVLFHFDIESLSEKGCES